MNCPICTTHSPIVLTHTVRDKYDGRYCLCPECDLLFVAEPTWLRIAYEEPINTTDIGYVSRNVYLSRKTLILFFLLFRNKGSFVDYAAGYGMLVRLMRDYGLDFYWADRYTKNLFAKGFEYTQGKMQALTCFECLEHLEKPLEDIERMLNISTTLFFSTRLRSIGSVPDASWEYYGWNHGRHVSFYSEKTLRFIAQKYNIKLYTDGSNLHLFTERKLFSSILRIVNLLTKFQFDLFLRKGMRSKLESDHVDLLARGL